MREAVLREEEPGAAHEKPSDRWWEEARVSAMRQQICQDWPTQESYYNPQQCATLHLRGKKYWKNSVYVEGVPVIYIYASYLIQGYVYSLMKNARIIFSPLRHVPVPIVPV
jgi:hypothetical protein